MSFASPNLTWTGNLPPGGTATITFSVTVEEPRHWRRVLADHHRLATAGSNCPRGSSDPGCTTTVTVSGLTIASTADVSSTAPGGAVRYTVTVTNSGQTPYTGAKFTDPLAGPRRRHLQQRRRREHRRRVVRQPEPDLDREPRRRRHATVTLGHGA